MRSRSRQTRSASSATSRSRLRNLRSPSSVSRRNPSKSPKKNALFCTIGPPSVPPYWLRRSGVFDPSTGVIFEGGVTAEAECVLHNLVTVLDAAGLTLADVVKTTCFLTDINDYAAFNEVYGKLMTTTPPPARSAFAVAALPRGARIEIEAIAVRSED